MYLHEGWQLCPIHLNEVQPYHPWPRKSLPAFQPPKEVARTSLPEIHQEQTPFHTSLHLTYCFSSTTTDCINTRIFSWIETSPTQSDHSFFITRSGRLIRSLPSIRSNSVVFLILNLHSWFILPSQVPVSWNLSLLLLYALVSVLNWPPLLFKYKAISVMTDVVSGTLVPELRVNQTSHPAYPQTLTCDKIFYKLQIILFYRILSWLEKGVVTSCPQEVIWIVKGTVKT